MLVDVNLGSTGCHSIFRYESQYIRVDNISNDYRALISQTNRWSELFVPKYEIYYVNESPLIYFGYGGDSHLLKPLLKSYEILKE